MLSWLGWSAGVLGVTLALSTLLLHLLNWWVTASPISRGMGPALLYIIGGTAAEPGLAGWAVWAGLAAAGYGIGLGFFARWLRTPARVAWWPALLLPIPIVLAFILNVGKYREPALLLSAVLALWVVRSLRPTLWSVERDLHLTVAGLSAGSILVDLLLACPVIVSTVLDRYRPHPIVFVFVGLFLLTLALQRLAPEIENRD
jgi:hypothetical protein